MGKVKTMAEFSEIQADKKGCFVITDNANKPGAKVHSVTCSHVTKARFEEKVVQNECKNGEYFWFETEEQAKAHFQHAAFCSFCY